MNDSYSKIVLTNPVSDIIVNALPKTKYNDQTTRSSTLSLASNPNTTFCLINFLKNVIGINLFFSSNFTDRCIISILISYTDSLFHWFNHLKKGTNFIDGLALVIFTQLFLSLKGTNMYKNKIYSKKE